MIDPRCAARALQGGVAVSRRRRVFSVVVSLVVASLGLSIAAPNSVAVGCNSAGVLCPLNTGAYYLANPAGVVTNAAGGDGRLNFTNSISLSPTNDYYRTRYVP